jgi:hypothetical protein
VTTAAWEPGLGLLYNAVGEEGAESFAAATQAQPRTRDEAGLGDLPSRNPIPPGLWVALATILVASVLGGSAAIAAFVASNDNDTAIAEIRAATAFDEAQQEQDECLREIAGRFDFYFTLRTDIALSDGRSYSPDLVDELAAVGVDPGGLLPPAEAVPALFAQAAADRLRASTVPPTLCQLTVEPPKDPRR